MGFGQRKFNTWRSIVSLMPQVDQTAKQCNPQIRSVFVGPSLVLQKYAHPDLILDGALARSQECKETRGLQTCALWETHKIASRSFWWELSPRSWQFWTCFQSKEGVFWEILKQGRYWPSSIIVEARDQSITTYGTRCFRDIFCFRLAGRPQIYVWSVSHRVWSDSSCGHWPAPVALTELVSQICGGSQPNFLGSVYRL